MTDLLDSLDLVAADCCKGLSPSGEARPIGAQPILPTSELVAIVAFWGDHLRGVIGLSASIEALAATHPRALDGHSITEHDVQDWIGESSNQLLGRLKSQLQRYGVVLWMGTPTVLRGVAVSVRASGGQVRRYALELASGQIYTFWLDIELLDGFVCHPAADVDGEPQPGDLLLF